METFSFPIFYANSFPHDQEAYPKPILDLDQDS